MDPPLQYSHPYHSYGPWVSSATSSLNRTFGNTTYRPSIVVSGGSWSYPATFLPSRNTTSNYTTLPSSSTSEYILGYKEYCALWNSSCSGKPDAAFGAFTEDVHWWNGSLCNQYNECTVNEQSVPPASKIDFDELLHFARSPECASRYGLNQAGDVPGGFGNPQPYGSMGPCCGPCHFVPTVVDLYYWPEPDADTSCLSLIGGSVNPPDFGATTSESETLWNCITASELANGTTTYGYLRTATLTSVGSITYKSLDYNPWFPPTLCLNTSSQQPSVTSKAQSNHLRIRGHPRSLRLGGQESNSNSSGQPTVQQDGFIFTSPSVYINFHNLQATDSCGAVGPSQGYTSTMVAFDPEELSTMLGEFYTIQGEKRSLNVADLPCPPKDVMVEAWYTPAPGEPYFPLVALPTKVQHLNSLWAACSDDYCPFTGFDPPRSLSPVSRMTPETTVDPASLPTREPSNGESPKASAGSQSSIPSPAAIPSLGQAAKTFDPIIMPTFVGSPGASNSDPLSGSQNHGSGSPPNIPDVGSTDTNPLHQNGPHDSPKSHAVPSFGPGSNGQGTGANTQNPWGLTDDGPSSQGMESNHIIPEGNEQLSDPLLTVTILPNGIPVKADRGGNYIYQGATMVAGAPMRPVLGKPVSLGFSSNLEVSGKTYKLPPIPGAAQPLTTFFAGQSITFGSGSVLVAGMTLRPGNPMTYLSGTKLSLGSTAFVMGSQTLALPTPDGGSSGQGSSDHQVPQTENAVVIAGTTLLPDGAPVTISGTLVTMTSSALIIGSKTVSFSSITEPEVLATVAGHVATLIPMGASQAFAATHVTATGPGEDPMNPSVGAKSTPTTDAYGLSLITTVAGRVATLLPDAIVILGTTLHPGDSPITIAGTIFSLNSDALVAGTQTVPVMLPSATDARIVTSVAGDPITSVADGFAVDGTTLQPGKPGVIVHGTPVSVDAEGQLVIGTSVDSAIALGSVIMEGFESAPSDVQQTVASVIGPNGSNTPSNSSIGVEAFQGHAQQTGSSLLLLIGLFAVLLTRYWG